DLVWPAPLDTAGGRVVLHGRDAAGAEVVLSEIEYGTPTLPSPPGGASLIWDAFNSRYTLRSPSTPTDLGGSPHAPRACLVASSVRIREILTSCTAPRASESYIELSATLDGEKRDSTLAVEIRDASDSLVAAVPAGFGERAGQSWPRGTSWLIATPGISNVVGSRADAPLPLALDPVAGRVDLVRRGGRARPRRQP